MKVLKVIGKILAILLAVVLFSLELTFQAVKPISSTISNTKELIKNIEISELFFGDTEEYNEFVSDVSEQVGVSVEQAKDFIESKAIKSAIGEVMESVVGVVSGNEDAKLSKEEIKDLVSNTIDDLKEEVDIKLPENIKEEVEKIVDELNLDDFYKELEKMFIKQQPVSYVTNQPVLSSKQMTGVIVQKDMSLIDGISLLVQRKLETGLIIAIIIIVGLIFLFQFSISGGLMETGIVTILAGIPMLFIEPLKNDLLGMVGELDSTALAIFNAFNFHAYTTNAIICIVIGVILLAGGIVLAKINKNKKAKASENVEIKENSTKEE